LGGDCIHVRHSWNFRDKMKTTKNNESRTVEVPFPSLIHALLDLAKNNPHGASMDSFIFCGNIKNFQSVKDAIYGYFDIKAS